MAPEREDLPTQKLRMLREILDEAVPLRGRYLLEYASPTGAESGPWRGVYPEETFDVPHEALQSWRNFAETRRERYRWRIADSAASHLHFRQVHWGDGAARVRDIWHGEFPWAFDDYPWVIKLPRHTALEVRFEQHSEITSAGQIVDAGFGAANYQLDGRLFTIQADSCDRWHLLLGRYPLTMD
jgi:hypothetical protein